MADTMWIILILVFVCGFDIQLLQAQLTSALQTEEGEQVTLSCGLSGSYTYPAWRGPPSLTIYTILDDTSGTINSAAPAANRLKYASNNQDLLLSSPVTGDSGVYKCSYTALGDHTITLTISKKTTSAPSPERCCCWCWWGCCYDCDDDIGMCVLCWLVFILMICLMLYIVGIVIGAIWINTNCCCKCFYRCKDSDCCECCDCCGRNTYVRCLCCTSLPCGVLCNITLLPFWYQILWATVIGIPVALGIYTIWRCCGRKVFYVKIKITSLQLNEEILAAGENVELLAITHELKAALQKLFDQLPGFIEVQIKGFEYSNTAEVPQVRTTRPVFVKFLIKTDGRSTEKKIKLMLTVTLSTKKLGKYEVSTDGFEFCKTEGSDDVKPKEEKPRHETKTHILHCCIRSDCVGGERQEVEGEETQRGNPGRGQKKTEPKKKKSVVHVENEQHNQGRKHREQPSLPSGAGAVTGTTLHGREDSDSAVSRGQVDLQESDRTLKKRPMPEIPRANDRQGHDSKGRGLSANFSDDDHPLIGIDIPSKRAGALGSLPEGTGGEGQVKKLKKKKRKSKEDQEDEV